MNFQGPIATAVIGLSQPIGIVLGQGITPLFVRQPSDVPLLNIIWFVPAAVGLILALTTIKTSMPPTPPSRSASIVFEHGLQECTNYIKTLKSLLTNVPCLLLSICIGMIKIVFFGIHFWKNVKILRWRILLTLYTYVYE